MRMAFEIFPEILAYAIVNNVELIVPNTSSPFSSTRIRRSLGASVLPTVVVVTELVEVPRL